MRATIASARRTCEEIGARQVIVLAFDGSGRFAVVSYGETRQECRAVARVADVLADGLKSGDIAAPIIRSEDYLR